MSAIEGINHRYQERTFRHSTLKLSKADIKYGCETVNVELGIWECEKERNWKPIKWLTALNILYNEFLNCKVKKLLSESQKIFSIEFPPTSSFLVRYLPTSWGSRPF